MTDSLIDSLYSNIRQLTVNYTRPSEDKLSISLVTGSVVK